IGLGNMGSAFAERLLDAGYDLVVHNRSRGRAAPLVARGATEAGSPAELAAAVDVVLTSLPDDGVLESIAAAVVAAARPGTVLAGLAQLMAEALGLGEASGVSRGVLLETMADSAAGAPFVKYKTEPLLRDDYTATFTTSLMEKDIDLVLEAAEAGGVVLPLAN